MYNLIFLQSYYIYIITKSKKIRYYMDLENFPLFSLFSNLSIIANH